MKKILQKMQRTLAVLLAVTMVVTLLPQNVAYVSAAENMAEGGVAANEVQPEDGIEETSEPENDVEDGTSESADDAEDETSESQDDENGSDRNDTGENNPDEDPQEEVTDVPDSESEETENDDFNDAPEAEEEVDEAATPAAQAESDAVDDVSDDEILTEEQIPDATLRKLLEYELNKNNSSGTPVELTKANLKIITFLSCIVNDNNGDKLAEIGADKAITNLKGIEYLTNLTSLHMSCQDFTDISPVASLSNLETLSLTDCNITTIPDLTGLSNLRNITIHFNKIPASEFTDAKMSANLLANQPNWKDQANSQREDASFIVSNIYPYAADSGEFYLYVELSGIRSRDWTVTAELDGNSETSYPFVKYNSQRNRYLSAKITGLSSGVHSVTLKAQESYGGDSLNVTKQITLKPVETMSLYQKYLQPGANYLSFFAFIPLKSNEKVTGAKLAEHGNSGNVVGITHYDYPPSVSNSYAGFWLQANGENVFSYGGLPDEVGSVCPYVSGSIYLSSRNLSGSYDLIIETSQGSYTIENYAVSEYANPIVTYISSNNIYDNQGDYYYVQLQGEGLAPDKFYPVLKLEDGTVVSEFVSLTSTYNGNTYTYKLKKLSNFPKSGYVYCDFVSKVDYPKVTMQEGRTNRLWISSSQYIATIVYNAKEKKFLLYAASDLAVGTKLQIGIKKGGYPTYDYSSNSYQDALATAGVTITGSETEVVFEDLRETPNYNGNAWAYFSARWQTGGSYQQTSGYVACYTSGFTNQSNAVSFGKQYYPTGTEIPVTVNVANNTVFGNGDELNATLTKDGTSITTKLTASVTGTTAGFTGTFTSDTIFSAGTYTLSVSNTAAGISSSTQIYLYEDNGKFYQTNQTVYSAQRNGKFYSYVYITANTAGLDQDKFEVEFYDLNKNKVEDAKLEEIYVNEAYDYIYFYYSGLAERYASVYCKVTYDGDLGIMPTTGEYFYNADERTYGRFSTVGSGISLSVTTGYGYRSVTSTAFPDYTVEVHNGRDGSLITSFDVNQIGIYTFTKKDLQKVIDQDPNLTKLYNLILKRNGYIYATATRVNISYDGAGTTEPPAPKEPTGISLSQTGVTLVKGSTFTLKATLKPSDAVSTLTWTSDKEEVATVNNSGVVTAVGEGAAKITVTTANNQSASCTITVVDYSIRNNGVAIDPSEPIVLNLADLDKNKTVLSVTKGDGSDLSAAEKLSWSSYNPSVATIDQSGKVTAIKGGTANIVATVTVNKTDIRLSCSVIVRSEVTGLELLSGRTKLESDGDTDILQLFVTPADQASGITVTWESSNSAIATVDNGKVTTQAWTEEAFGGADEAEVSITAKTTSAISNEEVSATWPYTIVKKDTVTEVPAGTKVYAVTNVDKTLGDAAIKAQLPDGWSFADENISLATFAGVKEKDFTILRENNVTGRISYDTVTVVFTTINGMTLCDESGNEVSKLMLPMASAAGATTPKAARLAYTVSGSDNNDRLLALDLRYRIEFAKNAKQDVLSAPVTDSYNGRAELSPLKAGNTTLLLQVFSDKIGGTGETVVYEKQWKVTVVDGSKGQAAINVELYDGNGKIDAKPESGGTEGIYELTVPSAETAANVYLQNNTEGSYKLTYKSSDTNVIKIGKATVAEPQKIPLTLGKAGTAVVTVTADDTLKTTKELLIKVANKKENIQASADSILISESTVTVNTALTTSDAVITVYNGFDGTLKSAILTPPANSELAGITAVPVQDGSGKNTNEIRFEASSDASAIVKAGKGKLTVTVAAGEDAGSAALTKEFDVNVKVTSKAPSVTVKQIDKVNTFYQDKPGHYAIGAAGETVTDVTLAPVTEGQSMNKGTDYSFDANTGVLTVNKVPEKTKKLNFRITVDGYKEVVPKNNVSVSTETANLKLSATSGTVYTDSGNMSLTIKLMDKTTGLSVDLSNVDVTVLTTSGNGTYTVSKNGDKLSLTTSAEPVSKGDKLTLKFASSNWNEAKEFSFTVKPALLSKAALQLGQKSLTLYNYKGMAASAGTPLTLKGGSELSELFTSANLSITENVNQKLGASLDKTLKVAYEDGSIKVGKNGESLKAGTYKFTIALSNTLWKNPLKANLSVKVVDVDMKDAKSSAKVKVSAKGSIDVLNRQGTSVTLTPKFTNVPKDAEIKDIQLTGTDAHLFEISRRTGNQIIIRLDDDANVITKYKYAVQVTYTVEAGDTSLTLTNSDPVKVKLTQKKPKIKVSGTKVYSNTKAESKKVTFALTNSTGASIEADRIVLLNCTKDFQYDLETGALTHSLKGETARGKSYTLKFAVYPKGCGDNEKPVTVNYKITIAK